MQAKDITILLDTRRSIDHATVIQILASVKSTIAEGLEDCASCCSNAFAATAESQHAQIMTALRTVQDAVSKIADSSEASEVDVKAALELMRDELNNVHSSTGLILSKVLCV